MVVLGAGLLVARSLLVGAVPAAAAPATASGLRHRRDLPAAGPPGPARPGPGARPRRVPRRPLGERRAASGARSSDSAARMRGGPAADGPVATFGCGRTSGGCASAPWRSPSSRSCSSSSRRGRDPRHRRPAPRRPGRHRVPRAAGGGLADAAVPPTAPCRRRRAWRTCPRQRGARSTARLTAGARHVRARERRQRSGGPARGGRASSPRRPRPIRGPAADPHSTFRGPPGRSAPVRAQVWGAGGGGGRRREPATPAGSRGCGDAAARGRRRRCRRRRPGRADRPRRPQAPGSCGPRWTSGGHDPRRPDGRRAAARRRGVPRGRTGRWPGGRTGAAAGAARPVLAATSCWAGPGRCCGR